MEVSQLAVVRRQWNDWRKGTVQIAQIAGLHWDRVSGGTGARAPRSFLMGYVWCDEVDGEIPHSCRHGEGPHSIKVCIVRADKDPGVFKKLSQSASAYSEELRS